MQANFEEAEEGLFIKWDCKLKGGGGRGGELLWIFFCIVIRASRVSHGGRSIEAVNTSIFRRREERKCCLGCLYVVWARRYNAQVYCT